VVCHQRHLSASIQLTLAHSPLTELQDSSSSFTRSLVIGYPNTCTNYIEDAEETLS